MSISAGGKRAVYNLDQDLRFASADDTALRYWGKDWSDILGRRLPEAFPQAVGSEAYEAHLWVQRSFRPFRGVLTSPVLTEAIDLEIHPSAQGLRVSFTMSAMQKLAVSAHPVKFGLSPWAHPGSGSPLMMAKP